MNRRLMRSPTDRVLGGVAGGMAETYDMDPALVRVVWALLIIFTGGVFLILYVIMALVVPLRGADQPLDYGTTSSWTPPPPPAGEDDATATPETAPTAAGAPWRAHERRAAGDNTGAVIMGTLLVIVGGIFLLNQFVRIDIGRLWPLAVIALGVLLIVSAFSRRQRAP
jgi:phage shock protein C